MANTSKQCGLRPLYPVIRANVYKCETSLAHYMYDPVTLNAGGFVQGCQHNTASGATPILGSIIGFLTGNFGPISYAYSGYVPANPAADQVDSNGYTRALVADSPDQLFVIEEDTGGTALTQAAVGLGGAFTIQGATTGNTISGVGNTVLDRSLTGTAPTSDLALQLIKLWDKPDNDYGNYAKWVVRIYGHQYAPGAGDGSGLV